MNATAVVAAEYEKRLSRLFAERFGAGEGGFARGVERVALYLPTDLAQRFHRLIADLTALKSGRAEVDSIEKFRAAADSLIAAVAAALPNAKPHGRRGSPHRAVFWHLAVALTAPVVGLSLNYALKFHMPLLVSVLLLWAWGGYLYWVIDRIVKLWFPPSVTRGGLRTLVAVLFFWCPVALALAILRLMDWRRRKYGSEYGAPHEVSNMVDDRSQFAVNPATGLPMMGSVDIGGNPYGFFGKRDN